MNQTKLKNYAPQARRDFIQAVMDRAAYYGLTAMPIEPVVEKGDVAIIAGEAISPCCGREAETVGGAFPAARP